MQTSLVASMKLLDTEPG